MKTIIILFLIGVLKIEAQSYVVTWDYSYHVNVECEQNKQKEDEFGRMGNNTTLAIGCFERIEKSKYRIFNTKKEALDFYEKIILEQKETFDAFNLGELSNIKIYKELKE